MQSSRASMLDINQLLQDEPMVSPYPPSDTLSLPPIRQVFGDELAQGVSMMSETSTNTVMSTDEDGDDDEEGQSNPGPVRHRRRHMATMSLSSTTSTTVTDDTTDRPKRRRADASQLAVLNSVFAHTFFPSTELRQRLGEQLGMSARSVQIWFQNKRQQWRQKKRQEDVQQPRPMPQQQVRIAPYPTAFQTVPLGGIPLAARRVDRPTEPLVVDPNRVVIQTRPLIFRPFLVNGQPGTPPDQPFSTLMPCGDEFFKGPMTPVSPIMTGIHLHGITSPY
jgi:hypothetical protein